MLFKVGIIGYVTEATFYIREPIPKLFSNKMLFKVGIIGYVTEATPQKSQPGPETKFLPIIKSIR